jgi:drug/metabolite transporter (DMT)-like permease
MYVTAIFLTVVSNVLYHVFQKMTPSSVHPLLSLTVTYLVAALVCLVFLPLYPLNGGVLPSLRQVNWASFGLGAAIVGLEMGFLLAYRGGWRISAAGLVSNVIVAVLLIPVGILLFREKLTVINSVGIATCILGLILVNWK